jgi:hypothetical protein
MFGYFLSNDHPQRGRRRRQRKEKTKPANPLISLVISAKGTNTQIQFPISEHARMSVACLLKKKEEKKRKRKKEKKNYLPDY